MTLPRSLQFYLSALSISRNRWKIRPLAQPTAQPGDTIQVDLPLALVDLDSLSMHFTVTTAAIAGATPAPTYCVLSANSESVIEQISVESAGNIIDPGCRYTNRMYQILTDWCVSPDKQRVREVLNNSRVPAVSGFMTGRTLAVNSFLGFLDSVQPRILDISLFGNMRVSIKLASNKVYMCDQPANASISYTNILFYCDTLDILDGGVFHAAVQKRLAGGDTLSLPFTRYYVQNSGLVNLSADTLIYNLNVGSLDWLMGVIVDQTALTTPNATQTYSAGDSFYEPTCKSAYFNHGLVTSNLSLDTSQMQVNNVSFPSYVSIPVEYFEQTVLALGVLKDTVGASAPWLTTLPTYATYNLTHIIPFTFPSPDADSRLRSGLNLLGGSGNAIQWTTTSVGSGQAQKMLFAKATPICRVGAYSQTEILP